MRKSIIILMIGMIYLIGIVSSQAGISFPSSFTMNLNSLPNQISSNQLIFNCPYDENIMFRLANIYRFDITTRNVTADIQYWTKDKSCAGSKRIDFIIPVSATQQQLINNFQSGVNNLFLIEANANRQPTNSSIISRGTA